jgi:hypothetical protein
MKDTNTITPETTLDELSELNRVLQAGPYRWSHTSTPRLDEAMAAAQGEMRAAEENRRNQHLKSSYADLGSVIRAVRPACSAHGIARYQTPWTGTDGKLYLTTRIAHAGEWVEADFRVPFEELKGLKLAQSVGNVLTYVKRYALVSMLGIASGEDDDAEASPEPVDLETRWRLAVEAFGGMGVGAQALLDAIGRAAPVTVTESDHEKLETLYNNLRRGDPSAREVFGLDS